MSLGQDHERLNRVADDGVRDGGDSLLFESSPDEGAGAHIIINFDSANTYLNTFFIRGPSSRRRFTGSLLNTRRTY